MDLRGGNRSKSNTDQLKPTGRVHGPCLLALKRKTVCRLPSLRPFFVAIRFCILIWLSGGYLPAHPRSGLINRWFDTFDIASGKRSIRQNIPQLYISTVPLRKTDRAFSKATWSVKSIHQKILRIFYSVNLTTNIRWNINWYVFSFSNYKCSNIRHFCYSTEAIHQTSKGSKVVQSLWRYCISRCRYSYSKSEANDIIWLTNRLTPFAALHSDPAEARRIIHD